MSFGSRLFTRAVEPLVQMTRRMRLTQLNALPVPDVDALFVGDSITEQGVWNEWFPEFKTANRGVGGDRTADLIARLDKVGTGKSVFLMIGTNDLAYGVKPEVIVRNVRTILERFPDSDRFIYSVLPRRAAFAKSIRALNAQYRSVATEIGATYIDLWPAFATPDGALRPELTGDHLHLNGDGYVAWINVLRPHLA